MSSRSEAHLPRDLSCIDPLHAWAKHAAFAAAISGQPKTRLRRRAILALFLERAALGAEGPILQEDLENALQTDPRDLIAALRHQDIGRLKRVRDRQLREDILLVKRALLSRL